MSPRDQGGDGPASRLDCIFCHPPQDRVFHDGRLVYGLLDGFPVNPGHALLIPKRHVASWFEATDEERAELIAALDIARERAATEHGADAFNIGINVGATAGQTVFHLHVHLIPRFPGDVPDPAGGVRFVVPQRARYPRTPAGGQTPPSPPAGPSRLVAGEDDPLLPRLAAALASAVAADFAVSFVLERGVARLEPYLREFLARGGRIRLVTGDYLGITEPHALTRLLDLGAGLEALDAADGTDNPDNPDPRRLEIRVFETHGHSSFHPKAYIFRGPPPPGRPGGAPPAASAFVGSSNISERALGDGLEWNYEVLGSHDRDGLADVVSAFDNLWGHPSTRPLDGDWIERYAARRHPTAVPDAVPSETLPPPTPNDVQQEALEALESARAAGHRAGLVVLATGLGKTWLAAFDSDREEFRRVLFVAHREEILEQAFRTFRRIRPRARLGLYVGGRRDLDAEVLFASIQGLGKAQALDRLAPDRFDYIVMDEFHHAEAPTYRRLIAHFRPKFLLGLTATPERTDGGNLLALCGENLVYRCDLGRGIERGLLCPFRYFGVPDVVDFRNIPWRNRRFDPTALDNAVMTEQRAQNALDQYLEHARGRRTLAFCASIPHAKYMARFFEEHGPVGIKVAAVHSGAGSAPRAASLDRLAAGDLDVLFAVDLFNEGVDVPAIDAVLMLRPTESRILWLQQVGRGLRLCDNKEDLTVVDYVGNHRSFLLPVRALFGLGGTGEEVVRTLRAYEQGTLTLPPGCEVTYDLEALEVLRALLPPKPLIQEYYEDFRERNGVRPQALEAFHDGFNPRAHGVHARFGSWFGFLEQMGDLSVERSALRGGSRAAEFLKRLETTAMEKSYKMVVLLTMLDDGLFPGRIPVDQLVAGFRRYAALHPGVAADLVDDLADDAALRRSIERNPVHFWSAGAGTGGVKFFGYSSGIFSTTFSVPDGQRETYQDMVREIAEWRLADYLVRPKVLERIRMRRMSAPDADAPAGHSAEPASIVIEVNHNRRHPILFPLDRASFPDMPVGPTPVWIDGTEYTAHFVKRAVNRVLRGSDRRNELPEILRGWFGPNAGASGTRHAVTLERTQDGWRISRRRADALSGGNTGTGTRTRTPFGRGF